MNEREHEVRSSGASPDGDDVEDHFEELYERSAGFRAAWDEIENDPRHILGDRVLKRRMELGLSQAKLARMVGTSPNRIYLIENGEANPTLDTLQRLASVLGISFEIRPAEAVAG